MHISNNHTFPFFYMYIQYISCCETIFLTGKTLFLNIVLKENLHV